MSVKKLNVSHICSCGAYSLLCTYLVHYEICEIGANSEGPMTSIHFQNISGAASQLKQSHAEIPVMVLMGICIAKCSKCLPKRSTPYLLQYFLLIIITHLSRISPAKMYDMLPPDDKLRVSIYGCVLDDDVCI